MKKVFLILIISLFSQVNFAQIKIDEFGALTYDDVSARLYFAYENIKDDSKQKAYFVIHKPENMPLGKFARYFYGIKSYWTTFLKYPPERIEIVAGEEKQKILTQVWRIDKSSQIPDAKIISLENQLRGKIIEKTLFDSDCIDCTSDPPIPLGIFYGDGLKFYAATLKANTQTRALILMSKNYRIKAIRDKLIGDYGIEAKRIKFQVRKSLPAESDVRFYIVPI